MTSNVTGAFSIAASSDASHLPRTPFEEKVHSKMERLTEKAESHYAKHRDQWVISRYRDLLIKDVPGPALNPRGAPNDRSARFMRAAEHLVAGKHATTLRNINQAGHRMLGHQSESERR